MDKICTCGHAEKKHVGLNETIEHRINNLVKTGVLIPHHFPDRAKPVFSFAAENNDKVYAYEDVEEILVNLRTNYSSCKARSLFGRCVCGSFKADNLKYLENLYEREASKIIH
jgi:hypothetical protein